MDVMGPERGGGQVDIPSCRVNDGRDGEPSASHRKAADPDVELCRVGESLQRLSASAGDHLLGGQIGKDGDQLPTVVAPATEVDRLVHVTESPVVSAN